MADDKTKRKADAKRVAMAQEHERRYVCAQLDSLTVVLMSTASDLQKLRQRMLAGFPKAKRARRKRR